MTMQRGPYKNDCVRILTAPLHVTERESRTPPHVSMHARAEWPYVRRARTHLPLPSSFITKTTRNECAAPTTRRPSHERTTWRFLAAKLLHVAHISCSSLTSSFSDTLPLLEDGEGKEVDSVAAAVAISDQIVLISVGAFIGIVALRFTSALFIRWLDLYPRLETAGFLAVAFVALRLIVHVFLPSLNQPDWLTLLVVLMLFAWGMSIRSGDFDRDESHAC